MAKKTSEGNRTKKYKSILIMKSNELVEARYRFTLWEMRLFEKMVKEIQRNDTEFRQVDIYIRDFIAEYDKKPNGKLYEEIRKAEELLLNRVVHIPYTDETGEARLKSYPLMAMIDRPQELNGYQAEGGFLSLKFNNDLSPHLLQLRQRFTQYDPAITKQIDSTYVIRTYELLKLYEFVGTKTLLLEEFREMIGAKEYDGRLKKVVKDTLKTWEHLKQRVLEPAYQEINAKADITFEYEPQYERRTGAGRKRVTGIRFFNIRAQGKQRAALPAPQDTGGQDVSAVFEDIYGRVREYVSSATVEKWFRDYPAEQIQRGVNYTFRYLMAGHVVRNVGGFLQAMVAIQDLQDPFEKRPPQAAGQDAAAHRLEAIRELEQKREQLRRMEFDRQLLIARKLLDTKPELRERFIEKARQNLFARYEAGKSLEENLENPAPLGFLVTFTQAEFPRAFAALSQEFTALHANLEGELAALRASGTP